MKNDVASRRLKEQKGTCLDQTVPGCYGMTGRVTVQCALRNVTNAYQFVKGNCASTFASATVQVKFRPPPIQRLHSNALHSSEIMNIND